MARKWKEFMRERVAQHRKWAATRNNNPFDVRHSSTRAGILAVLISASLILILYMFVAVDRQPQITMAKVDYSQLINNFNNNGIDAANVFKSANILAQTINDNILKLRHNVEVTTHKTNVMKDLSIFYREALPPNGHYVKGDILFLHGQAFTSANWLEKQSIQTFAAAGYRVVAVDLPGYGQTAGRTLSAQEKPELVFALIKALNLTQPVLISPSMSGAYSIPFMMKHSTMLSAFVPVAPVNAGDYTAEEYAMNNLPTLIVYGERDTSLGVFSASHLRALANGRVVKIPAAGHACYLNNAEVFHTVLLNFIDLVRTYNRSSENGNVTNGIY